MEEQKLPCVYFIHAEGTDIVKVGWTADLDRRFDQLQTASPHKLRLLGVHIGLKDVERVYHRDLQPYRQPGEWFFFTREVRRCGVVGSQPTARYGPEYSKIFMDAMESGFRNILGSDDAPEDSQ